MIPALRRWQRRRQLDRHAIPDELWRRTLGRDAVLAALAPAETARLRELATLFLAEKTFYGAAGETVTQWQGVRIAALAALPILGLDIEWYRGWQSLIVYPSGFLARHRHADEAGVIHEEAAELIGEASIDGPVVLSWEDVEAGRARDGWNVVLHELAHKLDMLNGDANGMPPLHRGMDREAWTRAFSEAFATLTAAVERHERPAVDAYAATDPAECFAVMSETFFETPEILQAAFPDVYRQMSGFYRQDPGVRTSTRGATT